MRNRRLFLKNAAATTSGLLGLSFISASKVKNDDTVMACGPDAPTAAGSAISTKKSGLWSDPSTWNGQIPGPGDTPVINAGHKVVLDLGFTSIAGMTVNGTLQFNPTKTAKLVTTKNVVVQGLLDLSPATFNVVHLLKFIDINESDFVGGGMTVLDSDTGLWVMGSGKLNINGTPKTSWTNATSGVKAGATSFSVLDATGWNVGDEIMIVPTEKPGFYTQDWIDSTGTLVDSFMPKFEVRIITQIKGNQISFAQPLRFNHLAVTSSVTSQSNVTTTKNWFPEVANLTRNVQIQGSKDTGDSYTAYKRSHIFICSSVAQQIKYLECKYLGPRKLQGKSRPQLITGRYGIHFHHCDDGSQGSLVEGCALINIGSRCYVPHVSNGVTMRNNIAFNALEEAFWWDWQDISHNTTWQNNLLAAIRLNGTSNNCTGMALGQGDNNIARGNVAVYANGGIEHNGGGAFSWLTDAEGVWIFENNLAHSCVTGIFVWQNSSHNHTIVNYSSYNCHEGVEHGAYGNCYIYTGGVHHNSKIFIEAVSGNTYGTVFKDTIFDAAGDDYCVKAVDSPIPSNSDATNKFINCVFRNYKKAPLQLASLLPDSNLQKQFKQIDLIICDIPWGTGYVMDDTDLYTLKDNSRIRIQPSAGQPVQTIKSGGKYISTNISRFAAQTWNYGTGLKGDYYNGSNFDSFAFSRVDSMIMFQQWSYDKALSPNGVHHLITGDQYSIQWTGSIMPQFTENHTFFLQGSGGHRLWIDGRLILDSWFEKPDDSTTYQSSVISLTSGKQYNIVLKHFNTTGKRGCLLYWQSQSMRVISNIPQCQLYPTPVSQTFQAAGPTSSTIADGQLKNAIITSLFVTAYPNPSPSTFSVQLKSNNDSPITLLLHDVTGRQVALYENINNNSTLKVGDSLQKGTYFLTAVQNDVTKHLTLIKL
ncbi:MAG TPA: PA14 domain-containing protein [Chitinophagaceae bacterium]|nr:PA14 domain-containing protein [Chitinophagaceae bacterium]